MSHVKKRTFDHTAAAIVVFDSTAAKRYRAWSEAETHEQVDAAERADTLAVQAVQDAYHLDTSDINSLASCRRIDIDSMRRIARGATPSTDMQHVDLEDAEDQAEAPAPR